MALWHNTRLRIVTKSKPELVSGDIDVYIVSFLDTYQECSRCVGLKLMRQSKVKNSHWGDILCSLPKTYMYFSASIKKCSYCHKTQLCPRHFEDGVRDSKHYTGTNSNELSMCSGCCWMHM